MQLEYVAIQNSGDTSKLDPIGSGHRQVLVWVGRKWCYVLNPFTLASVKLRLSVWRQIKPQSIVNPDWRIIRDAMTARLGFLERPMTHTETSALDFVHEKAGTAL